MKSILKTIFIFILFVSISFATTINVPAETSTIQGGIDIATNGDTVLVQAGTYVENIDFNGKNIVVGSLTLTTGDTSYISQTVIDGNRSGRVVTFGDGEDSTAVLCGFTLTNGYVDEWDGGGIYVSGSSPHLSYLLVKNNIATADGVWYDGGNGGGIFLAGSNAILENVSVKNNYAYGFDGSAGGGIHITNNSSPVLVNVKVIGNTISWPQGGGIYCNDSDPIFSNVTVTGNSAPYGGGIVFQGNSHPVFDPVNRSNIYFNESDSRGPDLLTWDSLQIAIIVDTFTVMQPDDYFVYPKNNFTFDIMNAKVEQVNSDLYVSPGGDDNNSGLSPMEPLKTISFALMRIMADSLEPHNIFLANGEYCPSFTGEKYPLNMRNYVSLQGESEAGVILSGESMVNEVIEFSGDKEITIENLTAKGEIFCSSSNPILSNLTITQSEDAGFRCIDSDYDSRPSLSNVTITKNSRHGIDCWYGGFPNLSNLTITDNGGYGISDAPNGLCLTNTILWNNISGNIKADDIDDTVYAFYSDIQGGWPGIGNINADPMFADTADGDYRLLQDSPCIDAGIQDTFLVYNNGQDTLWIPPTAYMGYAPDMGAHESPYFSTIENNGALPKNFTLIQNYPNPFNPITTIEFDLPKTSNVILKIFNILGEEVATLVSDRLTAGSYTYQWDAGNLASGVYLYRFETEGYVETRKMILMR
jgi:hypothetical protein